MMRRSRHARSRDAGDMSITAFMNLMVILVPFLLITAVFSRMAILELNLPAASSATQEPPQDLALEIIVREVGIEVGDRNHGLLKTLPNGEAGYDLEGLRAYLKDEVKARFPGKTDATLLLEPEIDYDT
ncbi:MAG: ExbD/TolR family protein, partial [Gammaproteobacteria bacterium]